MESEEHQRDPLLRALAQLPREDVDASRREHLRVRAHQELVRAVRGHENRPAAQLARAYSRVIEPILIASYGAYALLRVVQVLSRWAQAL